MVNRKGSSEGRMLVWEIWRVIHLGLPAPACTACCLLWLPGTGGSSAQRKQLAVRIPLRWETAYGLGVRELPNQPGWASAEPEQGRVWNKERNGMQEEKKKGCGLLNYTNRIAMAPVLGLILLNSKTVIFLKKKMNAKIVCGTYTKSQVFC